MKKLTFYLIITLISSFLHAIETTNEWEQQLSKYSQIYKKIKEYYPEKLNEKKIIFSSIRGLLRTLDPHSYFLDSLSLRSMNEDQQGNYYGIGIRITKYEDRLTVVAPLIGTPAFKLRIMAGDVIVKINGEKTKNLSLTDAMKRLRGAKGTFVNIKIKREGIDKLIPFKIKRAEIPLNSISYALIHPLEPKIGYISIRTFGNTTIKEFKKKFKKLKKKGGIKALILDLRGNRGGSLYSAIDISDLFLEKGKTIVSIKGRRLNQIFKAKENIQYKNLPLAILINRTSASASEIVAAALQYHQKATIIGSRSWGKGLVETVHKLSLNSALALTSAKYYTPDNKCLQRDFSELDNYYTIVYKKDYDTNRSIKGGVIPNINVKSKIVPPIIVDFFSRGLIFKFSRKLINSNFKIKKNFKAKKQIINKFEKLLKKNKIKYEKKEFKKHLTSIKYEIEREVFSSKFSPEEGIKIFLKSDPVSKKAVEILKIK